MKESAAGDGFTGVRGRTAPEHFSGPFADGPPPSALEVDEPPLVAFRPIDMCRSVVVVAVLSFSVVAALVDRLARRRNTSIAETACDGLVDGFIRLGPTFVKAGQIIASSGGMFPPVLAAAARRCLDEVPPFPAEAVRAQARAAIRALAPLIIERCAKAAGETRVLDDEDGGTHASGGR